MRLVIVDRDGVINADREDYVKSEHEFQALPGSLDALARLTRAGFEIVVATNQSGVGRGLYAAADVAAVHARLEREAGRRGARIAAFYVCPHAPLADCDCRKPAPGLLHRIAEDFRCDLAGVTMIGDSAKDLAAATAAGARPILVLTGQGAATLEAERKAGREPVHYADLAGAVDRLLAAEPGYLRRAFGSLAFNVGYMGGILLYSVPAFLSLPFSRRLLEGVAHAYARLFFGLMRRCVGLDYRIEGLEHLPEGPFLFYWKHQSTWETLAPLMLVTRPAYVLKRELLWIPLLGWSLAKLGAIGINRRARRKAVDQILVRGKRLLQRGFTIVIFPEGHRMPAGKSRRYGLSGALLARACGVPIVPVAHNAGDFWPRRAWLKRPGTVRVVIGPPVATAGRAAEAINLEAKRWIEGRMQHISVGYLMQSKRSDA